MFRVSMIQPIIGQEERDMSYRILGLISGAFLLNACASASVTQLQDNAANEYQFVADENYQEVYRRVSRMARSCWDGGLLFSPQAQRITDADLFSETGTAEVTIRMSNIANRVYAHILIERAGENSTNVTVWNHFSTWNHYPAKVQTWANGSQDCG